MVKGGYQIIDFGDKNHQLGVGMVHEGIYETIEGSRKALLLSGLTFEDTELHDCFAFPTVSGSNFVIPIVTYASEDIRYIIITVEDTDVVTVTIQA